MSDSKSTEDSEMAGGNFCLTCGEEMPNISDAIYRGFSQVELVHLHAEEL